MRLGSVRRFDRVEPSKEQALKPLEEAAEVFGAWQRLESFDKTYWCEFPAWRERIVSDLLDECADVIQATANLMASIGMEDARPLLRACRDRNAARGRIGDGHGTD